MPEPLNELEQQRSSIFEKIVRLPDFRSGSITATRGTCGKPTCHCHQPHHPGHGPHFRLTRKQNGKTVTETFATPAERLKAQREVEAYHRFRRLAQQLLEVNEKICRARPVEQELTPQKKTAETIQQEVAREVEHLLQLIFSERRKTGRMDFEAIEMAIRSALHQAGAAALTELLQFDPPGPKQRQLPCACDHTAHYVELRSKTVLTAVGKAACLRPYFLCEHCHRGQFPVDVELDVENTELSPGVRRMLATVGQQAAFEQGRQQMELLAGLSVTTKAVERTAEAIGADIEIRQQHELQQALQLTLPIPLGPRIPILYVEMDGTGLPVVGKETEGRAGKQDGQPAHTREAKLGCVFTQTKVDPEGYPLRDEDSTTYVGAIESAEEFGRRLYAEAWRRGWGRAKKKVVLGDGAEWVWNQADLHFCDATQIVDLYHARQHLWDLAAQLYSNDSPARWVMVKQNKLDNGKIEKLVASLHSLETSHPGLAETLQIEANYFERNKERMRYPQFREQGFFVGSGVIEAGCKTVLGRLKQSGMFWTVRGANSIIALRCCQLSGKFEDYWEVRRVRASL